MGMSRRTFLGISANTSALVAVGVPLPVLGVQRGNSERIQPASVKALVFDVFGTVVDWRTSVAAEVEAVGKSKGVTIDGLAFCRYMAGAHQHTPSMERA